MCYQIKKANKGYKPKDPLKRPAILYLTQENKENETIDRLFSLSADDTSDVMKNYTPTEAIKTFRKKGMYFIMKILKRNQIIISVLALMLITVGYMSYTSNVKDSLQTGALLDSETMAGIGDARLVNSNNSVENSENSSPNTEKNDNNENSTNSSDNSNDENVNNDKTAASSVSLQDDATEDGVSTDATSSSSSNLKTTSATTP